MKTRSPLIAQATATQSPADTFYRLIFLGGPLDGYETSSTGLPESHLDIPSGPADCRTRIANHTIPRKARYRWVATHLTSALGQPAVICRFDYCGSAPEDSASPEPLWRRGLQAIVHWWQRIEQPVGPLAAHFTSRSISRV